MNTVSPVWIPIQNLKKESPLTTSFYFDYPCTAQPGQFCMLSVPEFKERAFGLIVLDEKRFMITVAAVGKATNKLQTMLPGELLGFRGPFGTPFVLPEQKGTITLVAGGYGIAPLGYLAKEAAAKGYIVDLFLGAKTKSEIILYDFLQHPNIHMHLATDDGSEGQQGFITDIFTEYLKTTTTLKIYTVGPPAMEEKVELLCNLKQIPCEVSNKIVPSAKLFTQ